MEKFGTLEFRYFIKNDYVITPGGYGIVVKDEEEIDTTDYFLYSEVLVQHKNSNENNTNNRPIMVNRENVRLINRKSYENDK